RMMKLLSALYIPTVLIQYAQPNLIKLLPHNWPINAFNTTIALATSTVSNVHLNIYRGIRTWRVIVRLIRIHWTLLINSLDCPSINNIPSYSSARALVIWAVDQLEKEPITATLDLKLTDKVQALTKNMEQFIRVPSVYTAIKDWIYC